ncbi:MAG: SpoIIE family protein phosphatase [Bacteroidia bacterium]|nr:SpoIIE family protein phosphatase [Bacteroidia bacterium]
MFSHWVRGVILGLSLFLNFKSLGQNELTWANALAQKKGSINLIHSDYYPYTYRQHFNSTWIGIDQEILQEFQKFCIKKYGVYLTINQIYQPNFSQILPSLKNEHPNTIAIGSLSITEERKKQVDFTIPYMPDVDFLVTGRNIPIANSQTTLLNLLSGKIALLIKGTTLEEGIRNLTANYALAVQYKDCENIKSLTREILNNPDGFCYMEFSRYLNLIREGKILNRQDFFMLKREGYAFALPKSSDWKIPLNEFIADSSYTNTLNSIITKYLGSNIAKIILKTYDNDSSLLNKQYDILLAEKNIQRLQLVEQELALHKGMATRSYLISSIVIGIVFLIGLIYRNRYVSKNKAELLKKNQEIIFAKNELEQKKHETETQRDQLANALETVTVLSNIGRQLISQRSIEPILISVYQHVNKMIPAQEFTIGLIEQNHRQLQIPFCVMNGQRMQISPITLDQDNRLSVICYKQKRDFLMGNVSQEIHQYISNKESYKQGDLFNSLLCIPLLAGTEPIGFLSVQSDLLYAYTEFHLNILKNLSLYIVTALGNAEAFAEIMAQKQFLQEEKKQREKMLQKLESAYEEITRVNSLLENDNLRKTTELLDAQKVQMAMLPEKTPDSKYFDVAYNMTPATEVGGDYFDYKQFNEEKLLVAIGDATGHGYRAGIIVATAKSYFQSLPANISLTDALATISAGIRSLNIRSIFMGMHLIRIEKDSFEIATAGMPSILHFQAKNNKWTQIIQKGMFLGTNFPEDFQVAKIPFETNDILIILSDGLIEMFNENKEQPDYEDIINYCSYLSTKNSETILYGLQRYAQTWMENTIQQDDITLAVIKKVIPE